MTHSSPVNAELRDAIELASIGAGKTGYRSYPGTGGIWCGRNEGIADATFVDWGLARATALILNAAVEGRLSIPAQCVRCAELEAVLQNIAGDEQGILASSTTAGMLREYARSALTSPDRWTAQDIAEAKAEAKEMYDYFHPIQPQRMPVAWRWRHVNDPNFAWHYQETAIGNANEYLQVEPLYAHTRPECGSAK